MEFWGVAAMRLLVAVAALAVLPGPVIHGQATDPRAVALTSAETFVGSLTRDDVATHRVTVGEMDTVRVAVIATESLEVRLKVPATARPGLADALARISSTYRVNKPTLFLPPDADRGWHMLMLLTNPPPGMYEIELRKNRSKTDSARYRVAVTSRTGIRFAARTYPSPTVKGASTLIQAFVLRGATPLTAASVSATVRVAQGPAASVDTIRLLDDGVAPDAQRNDGIYSASYQPADTGFYVLNVAIQGSTASGARLERRTMVTMNVVPVDSALDAEVNASGVDTNEDGRFDHLRIRVQSPAFAKGPVDLEVRVGGASVVPTVVKETVAIPSMAGYSIDIPFSDILATGADTSVILEGIRIRSRTADRRWVTVRWKGPQMLRFHRSQMEHRSLEFAGPARLRALDTTAEGIVKGLTISVPLLLDSASDLSWRAEVRDALNNSSEVRDRVQLPAGRQSLSLTFSGCSLGKTLVRGPLTVANLVIWGDERPLAAPLVLRLGLQPGRLDCTADALPPVSSALVDTTVEHAITLRVTAKDGNSGVSSINYSLAGAQIGRGQIRDTVANLLISGVGTTKVLYWSVDKSGNRETPNQIVVTVH